MALEMELCMLLLETLVGPAKNVGRGRGKGVARPRMGLIGL
jgi:hypothetical protein